ncbi:MAG: discoidin domain-containing protein [Spirochaetales bacterium]|nr:discoidin domain-containing protein [Spirochaetales bacterium]
MKKKHLLLFLLFLLFFTVFSCAAAGSGKLKINKNTFQIEHNELARTGIIYVPESYSDQKKYSLVFGLHGRGSNAQGFVNYRFNDIADHFDFIMVCPNGIAGEWDVYPGPEGHDDIGLFRLLIREMRQKYNIDPERIYVTGHSMGGYMAYRMAYEMSDVIAGIAPVSGQVLGIWPDNAPSPGPVSVLHVHSLDDPIVPFNGNPGNYSLSAIQSMTLWRGLSGCLNEGVPFISKPGVRAVLWSGDNPDIAVGGIIYDRGGHSWLPETTELIADFFYNHPLRSNILRIDTDAINSFCETGTQIHIPVIMKNTDSVKKVSLCVDGTVIDEKTSAPFEFSWEPADPFFGLLTLMAEQKDGSVIKSSNSFRICVTKKNIAGKALVSASSIEDESLTPDKAADGEMNTRWSSAWYDPQWIKFEFSEQKTIDGLTLVWEGAYAVAYTVEVSSDGKNWQEVFKQSAGTGGTEMISFDPVQAKMIRLNGTERATRWGYSLWEILVHGDQFSPFRESSIAFR